MVLQSDCAGGVVLLDRYCQSLTSGFTTGLETTAVVLSAIGTSAALSDNSAIRRIADRKNEKNILSSLKIRSKQITGGIIGRAVSKGKSKAVVIW